MQNYLLRAVKVRPVLLCNDDGSDSGALTMSQFQDGLAKANEVLESSNANVVYIPDPETDLGSCVHDSLANYDCFLKPELFPGKSQLEITESDLAGLTVCDLNQDGKCNDDDVNHLCDTNKQGVRRMNLSYDHIGNIAVFIRGKTQARRRVQFDEALGHWIFKYPSGGYSSCAGNYAVMNSGWWGNLLAHETGHYLCSPHTFSRPPTDDQNAAETIVAVIDKYNLDPNNKENVLISTFDGDRNSVDILVGTHVIEDTPPDPGPTLWEAHFGDGNACVPENESIPITVNDFGSPITYVLQPDRSLIMSYFKGCTALGQHFSPDEVERIDLSFSHHRKHLVNADVVQCYDNKYNNVDWTGMSPEQAVNQKEYFLDFCQNGPSLLEPNRTYYPIRKPFIDTGDPLRTRMVEDKEIQEEIQLDLKLQKLGLLNSLSPVQEIQNPLIGVQNPSHWLGRFLNRTSAGGTE
jgi:hypothetical protein